MARVRNDPLTDTFLDRLEDGGYRVTGSRREVALAVFRSRENFSVEDICRELPGVGRATVFRCVKLMVKMNLLCRVNLEGGRVHYTLAERGHHHHVICTQCGMINDLVGCELDKTLQAKARAQGIVMESHRLEVYGRCEDCVAA